MAAEVFLRGLDMDNLTEEFYQRLMVCYQGLGQKADAVKVYHRCRSVLSAALGVEPSSRTEEIYASLQGE